MTKRKLTEAEALDLWREAARRLRLIDREPPLTAARVDGLLQLLGPRPQGQSVAEWLARGRMAGSERPSAQIIAFNPRRHRFIPVAEITRLAADSDGAGIPLPARDLETADGRLRLSVALEVAQIVITVQALGPAADYFAGRTIGLAGSGADAPLAVLQLDEDGDGRVRLQDTPELRQALLKPVIGLIEHL
jgi:hypothetical protein